MFILIIDQLMKLGSLFTCLLQQRIQVIESTPIRVINQCKINQGFLLICPSTFTAIRSMQDTLKVLFPMVYGGGSRDSVFANNIYEMIKQYLESDSNNEISLYLKRKDKLQLLSQMAYSSRDLTKINTGIYVMFMCEYGCAIIISKEKVESAISIQIIVPEEWSSGSNSSKTQKLEICEPQAESLIYAPQLAEYELTLNKLVTYLQDQLGISLKGLSQDSEGSNTKGLFTTENIERAIKSLITAGQFRTYYKPKKDDKGQKDEKQDQQSSKISNVNTISSENIQFNSQNVDTAWYVVESVIRSLIVDRKDPNKARQKSDKLLVGFRMSILMQAVTQKVSSGKAQRQEIINYKKCLDELIHTYKAQVSAHTKKNERFVQVARKIQKKIIQANGGRIISKLDDSAEKNEIVYEPKRISHITKLDSIMHQKRTVEMVKISQLSYTEDNRFPFEHLLNMYQSETKMLQKDFINKTDYKLRLNEFLNHWILLVEKTLFQLTVYFVDSLKEDPYWICHIHMRQIQCEIGSSNLCSLIVLYEKIVSQNVLHFGMGLESQAKSHIELIKLIGAVIGFELVSINRQKRTSNLNQYRVPLNIEKLYQNFISHDYMARKAMISLRAYFKPRQNKSPLFELNGNCSSFEKFGALVGEETRSAHVWLAYMQQMVKSEIQKSQYYVKAFKRYGNAPIKQFKTENQWLFAFVHNIPPDVLGLIKLLMLAQNPEKNQKQDVLQDNQFVTMGSIQPIMNQKLPVVIHNKKPQSRQSGDVNFIQPSNNIKIVFQGCDHGKGLKTNLYQQESLKDTIEIEDPNMAQGQWYIKYYLKSFIKPPQDSQRQRQHQVYAKQYLKPINMQIQQFLALCTTRAAEYTQIPVLCHNVLKRKIIANCYQIGNHFGQQVFLHAAGQLKAYHPKIQACFNSIKNLLVQFINVWVFSDVNFCPILGPFFGFILRELCDSNSELYTQQITKSPFQLAKKCLKEFERGEKQLIDNPSLNIQWDQRFIVTAAICCFRQLQLTLNDTEQLIILAKLIFQLRSCKIFSDREQKPKDKRAFQKERAFSIQKAIFNNIIPLSDMFEFSKDKLSEVLRSIDEGFPLSVTWQRKGIYEFVGKSSQNQDDIYQVDLYRGCIYKNGKQLSALDPKIKQNPNYVAIFGVDRQFQVYPSREPHFLRTKNNLSHQFKVNRENEQLFFQFSEDGNNIRYIVKHLLGQQKAQEEIWHLVSPSFLKKSNVHLPLIFLQDHFGWLCQQKKCLIFRKKKYEEIYDIGLVIHLNDQSKDKYQIKKAFHVTFHGGFQNQNLQLICDPNNQIYEQLILRSKDQVLINLKPYKYLSRMEDSAYIFQLCNQQTKQIHFVLHRYQLRFNLRDNRLVSQSYYGYQVDFSYLDIKECLFNRFPCLVLRKDDTNQMIMNSHKRILIISDGKVIDNGTINKSKAANVHINSFKYDIHDSFGDIRGQTRESQFHLVALMLSIDDCMRMQSIQMTPLQYGMHVLKTCFTNRPLTKNQIDKLNNIISMANDEVLLLCEVLWKGSQKLRGILPFKQQAGQKPSRALFNEKHLLQARTLYNKKKTKQTVTYRQSILENMLAFIGFILKQAVSADVSSHDSQSESSEFISETGWKNVPEFTGQDILTEIAAIENSFESICQKAEKVNFQKKDYQHKVKCQIYFPNDIQTNAVDSTNESLMMKQFIGQIKSSYQSFVNYEAKIENICNDLSQINKPRYLKIVEDLVEDSKNCSQRIDKLISRIKSDNQSHPDVISGFRPTLCETCYTSMLINKDQIYAYYPRISAKSAEKLRLVIKIWMVLQTRIASFQRIIIYLNNQKVDIVALLREVGSPRKEIFKKTEWICFETQMKIQIWPSQLETYQNLMSKSKEGPFCQLNMGEGKTQVIIPMIILNIIFSKNRSLPRINLLASLYEQARGNMFKFLSVTGFQIPGFEVPFTRKVELNQHNIYCIRDLMNCFSGRAFLLVNRESRLSEILRYNEVALKPNSKINIDTFPLLDCKIFDIFDEIDAMMTPKKSYIFSIGKKIDLPSACIRLEIVRQCIEIFATTSLQQLLKDKMAITDETQQNAIQQSKRGRYPDGLRLTPENVPSSKIRSWKESVIKLLLKDSRRHEYSFMKKLNDQELDKVIAYCVDPSASSTMLPSKIPKGSKDQIYILRGAFAYGILQHCLSKRCGVDYGVPGSEHAKKIAVPYEAADIPSKTSEYEHPEVSAILSYIAYYMKGLTKKQFRQCLQSLLQLTSTSMEGEYEKWLDILGKEDRKNLIIDQAKKINLKSKADQLRLYQIFHRNRRTIAFWLNKCVFPRDLVQYKENISSSSFDLAHVDESVGFSGTMDNHWILPNKIKYMPCQTPSIKGTDGKMIYLTTKYTKQVAIIAQNQKPLWQRFIDLSLSKKVGCLIDVGAICVGKSLKNQIVPWIAEHQQFNNEKYVGISFCDQNGKWQVYDIEAKFYISRGTTIPDHQTFVIFDEARTRGADLKLDNDVVAAMSLGPDLTKDKFMQAAGRLRKLGRNQSLIILATHQVFASLPTFPKTIEQIDNKLAGTPVKQIIALVMAWCCKNTVHQNENLLIQYSNLGWKYIYSKVKKVPYKQELICELKQKYESTLETRTVADISKETSSKKEQACQEHQTGKHLRLILQKYGKNVRKQAGALDDVCERQVEAEKQKQKTQEDSLDKLSPIQQSNYPKICTSIEGTDYKLHETLKMTSNFLMTTQACDKSKKNSNQLSLCYFVKYNSQEMVLISMREASLFIKENIMTESSNNYKISLLADLDINNKFIKSNNLAPALVQAKFISGQENYKINEQDLLLDFLLRSLKSRQNKQGEPRKYYEMMVSQILRKRRIYNNKFSGSTLQEMITKLINEE